VEPRLTVSEATARIRACLDEGLGPLWVEGEISNFVAHRSGHFYFTLKDAACQLRCVMFRNANLRLRFLPQDGMQGALFGRITVYERSGQYQLLVERLLPLGAGELQLAFDQLKERLAAEGLFAPERKQRLPIFPETIGVATSPSGAVIRDIQRVLRRRWPPVRIVLRPTQVQGPGAAADIARAIEELNRCPGIDLLIVGRGGGSLEDLWAFNEEIVARAITASRLPVISAVGHETDTTISDFVADLRAPTPSAAAESAVRDFREVLGEVRGTLQRCERGAGRRLSELRLRLISIEKGPALRSPLDRVRQAAQRADELLQRALRGAQVTLTAVREKLARLAVQLDALSPEAVLERGYALVFDESGGLVPGTHGTAPGARLRVQLRDGDLDCRVEACRPSRSPDPGTPGLKRKRGGREIGGRG
jgi:exodeoxyribonuclease VII large subunit